MRSNALLFTTLAAVSLAACGGGGSGGSGGSTTTTPTTTSATTTTSSTTTADGGSGGATSTTSSTGTGGATSTTSSTGAGGDIPVNACSDIGAADCFSNLDCPAADRCENKSTTAIEVPCCVPGARGTGKLGDTCTGENDCETSLCVETSGGSFCSGVCASDTDCIPALSACTDIPALLGMGSFCLPP